MRGDEYVDGNHQDANHRDCEAEADGVNCEVIALGGVNVVLYDDAGEDEESLSSTTHVPG